MFDRIRPFIASLALAMLVILHTGIEATAQDLPLPLPKPSSDLSWRVSKSSGDVSVQASGVQQASLTDGTIVKPGDTVRTGRNGRALLLRGEESILVEPNSIVGIPTETKQGLSTTVIQKAGSILLEVEKRNVKHFEVETPYLAAVVKGTQFRVTVDKRGARVDVLRGQVEVSDFKSGKYALVLPGQAARVSAHAGGLTLSGSGKFNPIQKGEPRASSVKPVSAPEKDRPSLRGASNGNPLHIAAPLGEAKLDINKATQGLARDSSADNARNNKNGSNSNARASDRDGSNAYAKAGGSGFGSEDGGGNGGGNGNGLGNGNGVGNGNGGGNSSGSNAGGNGNGLALGLVKKTAAGVTGKLKLSDIRLKRDIVPVGQLDNGLGLYRYRYLWSDTIYVGVMAQEVELVRPDAVLRGVDGYLRVDYGALGLRFQTFDEWSTLPKSKAIAAPAQH